MKTYNQFIQDSKRDWAIARELKNKPWAERYRAVKNIFKDRLPGTKLSYVDSWARSAAKRIAKDKEPGFIVEATDRYLQKYYRSYSLLSGNLPAFGATKNLVRYSINDPARLP